MIELKKLPSVSRLVFHDLSADEKLKHKILSQVAYTEPKKKRTLYRMIPAACCLATVVLVIFVFINIFRNNDPDVFPMINTLPAGLPRVVNPVSLHTVTTNIQSEAVTDHAYIFDGDISSGIWERSHNGYFPLVQIKDKAYRLLSSSSCSLSVDDLEPLSEYIQLYTQEPALAPSDRPFSNILQENTPLYKISGVNQSFIAAILDDNVLVFQRACFNGKSILKNEAFSETVAPESSVIALEIPGFGIISDENTARNLYQILCDNAVFESASSVSGNDHMIIRLKNGLSQQLSVNGYRFFACGTWTCPEFWDALQAL